MKAVIMLINAFVLIMNTVQLLSEECEACATIEDMLEEADAQKLQG